MLTTAIDRWFEGAFMRALTRLQRGRLTVEWPGGVRTFGDSAAPAARLRIHHPGFFRRIAAGGEVALGDAYMDGWRSTPDLVALVRLMLVNRDVLPALSSVASWVPRALATAAHWRRDNTRAGSQRNIHEHYDLGNQFFELFLDSNLLYSCAIYDGPGMSLEAAQVNKLRTICDRLELGPDDHVLEIGTGWGGFALFAATRYGCRVTTTTISAEQYGYAAALFAGAGDAARRIDRLLAEDGAMLMQTITVDDWRFAEYTSSPSWIAKRIFPGAELASVAEILASLRRVTRLGLHHARAIGPHYAHTLRQWRERFHARLDVVKGQGFAERFIRMWDLYLAFCEAAFEERHIGNVQLVLTKSAARLRDAALSVQTAPSVA